MLKTGGNTRASNPPNCLRRKREVEWRGMRILESLAPAKLLQGNGIEEKTSFCKISFYSGGVVGKLVYPTREEGMRHVELARELVERGLEDAVPYFGFREVKTPSGKLIELLSTKIDGVPASSKELREVGELEGRMHHAGVFVGKQERWKLQNYLKRKKDGKLFFIDIDLQDGRAEAKEGLSLETRLELLSDFVETNRFYFNKKNLREFVEGYVEGYLKSRKGTGKERMAEIIFSKLAPILETTQYGYDNPACF